MELGSPSATATKGNALKSVYLPAIRNFLISVIVLGVVLGLLAGTFTSWRIWVFTVLFVFLTTSQGVYLAIRDPELLERRKQIAPEGESRGEKVFMAVGLLSNLCLLVFSTLDHRFGWSRVPALVSVVGDGLLVFSFFLYYLVPKANSYAASSIKTFEGQKVVSTGPYGRVRHPKYVGDLFLVLGMPLALGSWWSLAFVLLAIPALAWRILDEEKLLKKELPGYVAYTQKVRYRLVPYLW